MIRLLTFTASWLMCTLLLPGEAAAQEETCGGDQGALVIEDFEANDTGKNPAGWKYVYKREELRPMPDEPVLDNDYFMVEQEGDNKFIRGYTEDEAMNIILANGEGFNWNLNRRPCLRWRWRANRLPEGASEEDEKLNDAGAAVYVVFSRDWLGRPKGIKYTYSSTLPAGTTVSYGSLKVLVVASEPEDGTGEWQTVVRNVAEDYRRLFGSEPKSRPPTIALWSDSDSVHGVSEADFDDITLVPSADASASVQ